MVLQIDLNRTTLNWPSKIAPIFEENDEIVAEAKKQGRTIKFRRHALSNVLTSRQSMKKLELAKSSVIAVLLDVFVV